MNSSNKKPDGPTRRHFLKMLGSTFVSHATPTPIKIIGSAISPNAVMATRLNKADLLEALTKNPEFSPIYAMLCLDQEFYEREKDEETIFKDLMRANSEAGLLGSERAATIALEILNGHGADTIVREKMLGEARSFFESAPTPDTLRAFVYDSGFQVSPERNEYLRSLSNEEIIEELQSLLARGMQGVTARIDELFDGSHDLMKRITRLGAANAEVSHEIKKIQKENQQELNPSYPSFATKYRENSFPIPHDYYATPKADSWAERAALKPSHEGKAL
jgi:hypothetical protein